VTVELTIDSLGAGGDGVARDAGGRVTFVSRSAPGDRVRVDITEEKKQFARASIVEILEPSPDRVAPPCALFDRCGGCQWQHVSAEAQLRAKQDIVASALRHALDAGMELRPIVAKVSPLGWRRRARMHWVRRQKGRGVMLGFYEAGSRHVVDVPECPQLEPALQAALVELRERLAPGLSGSGELSMVLGAAGDVHVDVRGPCDPRAVASVVGKAGIAGVRIGRREVGAAGVEVDPGIHVGAREFAQASRAGNDALCEVVDEATSSRHGKRVLELYAGGGNLTRVLADGAAQVVAVDAAPGGRRKGVSWRKGDVADVVATFAETGEVFDIAVLDPPRAGAADVLSALAAIAPPLIVYVSCNPATLARDIERLRGAGYRPAWARAVDLMPQTSHVEVVATLTRPAAETTV
jgi:23S rRNA (uracil1939-C5)-methyltransferase